MPTVTCASLHREPVSLLKSKTPAVYVSKVLPRMDELKDARTRPLTEFEAAALAKLRAGEDLDSRSSLNRIHLLGSVRALKQCLECHNVQRGELLGAFSYELMRVPPRSAMPGDEPAAE
jgi:hypothetical protein